MCKQLPEGWCEGWGDRVKDGKNGSQSCRGTWSCPASGCEGKDLGCLEERNSMWVKSGRAAGRKWQAPECWPEVFPSRPLSASLQPCVGGEGGVERRKGVKQSLQAVAGFWSLSKSSEEPRKGFKLQQDMVGSSSQYSTWNQRKGALHSRNLLFPPP